MGNAENLKPMHKGDKRSPESIEKQKATCARKRLLKEIVRAMLDEAQKGHNMSVREEILMMQIQKALDGDLKSCEFLFKAGGELVDEQKIDIKGEMKIEPVTGITVVEDDKEE